MNFSPPNAATADAAAAAYAWRALSVTSLGVLLCFVNASTLNVALPVIAHDLHASASQASWILLSYMLVTTALILVFGRMADLLGRRRLYIIGLSALVIASAGCALSNGTTMLLFFRCLQAVGAAAVITNTTALLTDAFPSRLLGMGLGVNATISAAAQGLGPLIGGVIVTHFGWRAIFLLNLPIGLLALFFARRVLRDVHAKAAERFDGFGAALSVLGLFGVVYALSMGGVLGWADPEVGMAGAVGLLALVAFVISQGKRKHPLIDLGLFADAERSLAYTLVTLVSMTQISSILLLALFLQAAHGFDPMHAGISVAPWAFGMMIASPVAGRLIGRMPNLTLCLIGMAICCLGLLVLSLVTASVQPRFGIMLGLLFLGMGTGLFLTPNTNTIMHSVAPARRGVANGVRSALQNTGYVLGTALVLSIATAPLSPASQKAAYAGRLSALSTQDTLAFVGGCRTAMYVLLAMTFASLIAAICIGYGSFAGIRVRGNAGK